MEYAQQVENDDLRVHGWKDVDVGLIYNGRHARAKAAEYTANNPGWEWTGLWTSREGTSVIVVENVRF